MLAEFEDYAAKAMKEWETPGMAVAVVRNGKVVYAKGFGVKKLGGNDPVDTGTVFQVGSTSKAFTSTLVAMMVDEGKLAWTDKVVDHLPGFRVYDPWVTAQFEVRDLMAQRSGLATQAAGSLPIVGYNRREIMEKVRHIQPDTSFRTEFAYLNCPFLYAAALVEKYTGRTWEENLRERIFGPLGMTSSSSEWAAYQSAANVSGLHRRVNDDPQGPIYVIPPDWPFNDWVYTYGPAGSIGSSVDDMSRWLRLHMAAGEFEGRRLVSPESIGYTHTPKTIIDAPLTGGTQKYYCLGWLYETYRPYPIVWHNGGTMGAKTIISFVPEAGIGLVVLSNLAHTLLPEALQLKFYDLYFGNEPRDWSVEMLAKAVSGGGQPERPAAPRPPMPLEKYEGTYRNDLYGDIKVAASQSALTVTIGPKNIPWPLTHWDGDIFEVALPEFNEHMEFARFQTGPDGGVETLVIDFLNVGETGVFIRRE